MSCGLVLVASAGGQGTDSRQVPGKRSPAVKPDTISGAILKTFAKIAAAKSPAEREQNLGGARKLAHLYAAERNDSFLVREVVRFQALTPQQQKVRVAADSARAAGNTAVGTLGVRDAMRSWRAALHDARSINDPGSIAPALVAIGGGFYRLSSFDSAGTYLDAGKAIATRIGDRRTAANAIGISASISKERGDLTRALALYEAASKMRSLCGDTRGIAADQNNIGLIARERGQYAVAAAAFQRALTINESEHRNSLAALNLSNLAGLASDVADFSRADSLYRKALAIQRHQGDSAETAFVLHDLGRLRIRRGDYTGAAAVLTEAQAIHRKSGAAADAILVTSDLAKVQSAMGDPGAAIRSLREAELAANGIDDSNATRADLLITRGDLALQFGALNEAERAYAGANVLYRRTSSTQGRSRALYGLATVDFIRKQYGASLGLLKDAMALQSAQRDGTGQATSLLLKGSVEQAQEKLSLSRQSFVAAQNTFRGLANPVGEAAALEMLGTLALRSDSIKAAEGYYQRGLDRLDARRALDVSWRLKAGLGLALYQEGKLDRAEQRFSEAISIAEKSAAAISHPEQRNGFFNDKWSVYANLAALQQARGKTADAFATNERMRAREMVELFSRNKPEPSARLSDLASPKSPRHPATDAAVTATTRDISSRLAGDEVMLEYLLGDSTCIVFVITKDSAVSLVLPAGSDLIRSLISFSRRAVAAPASGRMEDFWRPPLRRLYAELIQPVEKRGYLAGKRRLIVIPHGELHYISFASLIDSAPKPRFLVERFDIEYAPSATVWMQMAQRSTRNLSRGILAMAPDVDRLPASRDEVSAIARIYGKRATVRTGATASLAALRQNLPRAATVHFATFGVLNRRNPLFSFVALAPGPGEDGRLAINKVSGLGLSGQLVILSACQTALGWGVDGDVPPGDDWIGMVQAFLQSGASGVVASLWPVDDRATAALMERFHLQRAAGQTVTHSIAQAQRELMRGRGTGSPFYWGAFVVNGR